MTSPDYQYKPNIRMQKPISMQIPNNHIGGPFKDYDFYEVNPNDLCSEHELVFDPSFEVKSEGPQFSGDFECGNIGQVYRIGEKSYEIHLLPDPNEQQTTQWFFFRVSNLEPGNYFFCVVGFYRQCNLHYKGSKPCVYSECDSRNGIGWQRIGEDMNYFKWKSGKFPEWALSFKFTVKEKDTMYFAHAYPYTFTDLTNYLNRLPAKYEVSTLCTSVGGIQVPALFWDADEQKTIPIEEILKDKERIIHQPSEIREEDVSEFSEYIVKILREWKGRSDLPKGIEHNKKPVIIIVARTHPGETNSSYAMEGLMDIVFADNDLGKQMRTNFSWLLVPMINPDGVICGFYRPDLNGDDMNRIWQSPDPLMHPIASTILDVIDVLQRTRPIPFCLDFHGHTAACNSFVYGFMNENNSDLYSAERVFPLLMTKHTPLFSNEMCSFLKQKQYEGTMRVALRRKFHILFAYTLEMSYGGCDFGTRRNTQFTPHDYRSIGEATAKAVYDLLLLPSSLSSREAMLLMPAPDYKPHVEDDDFDTIIELGQKVKENKPSFFTFTVDDIKTTRPDSVKLVLNKYTNKD